MPARLPALAQASCPLDHGPSCLAGTKHASTFAKLTKCAPPPADRAGWQSACRSALTCIKEVGSLLETPSPEFLEFFIEVTELVQHLETIHSDFDEPSQPLWRRLAPYPQWAALTATSNHSDGRLLAALGIELLHARRRDGAMARESSRQLLRFTSSDLPSVSLIEILTAPSSALADASILARRLNRIWPQLGQWLEAKPLQEKVDQPSSSEKLRRALIAKAVFASPKHRGAILDHRHIDAPQLLDIAQRIGHEVLDGNGRAAAAMLAWLSSMTVGSLKDVPLAPCQSEDWVMCVDLAQGLFCTDIECIFVDQAAPRLGDGHIAACVQANKPLPQSLHRLLLERVTPDAKLLGDLLPELNDMKPEEALFPTTREISPSMARWTNSSGIFMRLIGIDGLVAAILSNDFSMAAKSKLYYTSVSADEVWTASAHLFERLGWGPCVDMPANQLAVGTPVVPTELQIERVFSATHQWIENARPPNRCSFEAVVDFHNRYSTGVVWLVAFATASRRVSHLDWTADMLTSSTGLLVLEDKQVSELAGGLPVPFGEFIQRQIDLYLRHLRALHERMERPPRAQTKDIRDWICNVNKGSDVPLFQIIKASGSTASVASSEVLKHLPKDCQVAPDCGRKFWETRLRQGGIQTSDIDAYLRHEVLGQERFSVASDFCVQASSSRLRRIVDKDLLRLFGSPLAGLRGANVGVRS